jgi:Caspase domain
MSEEVAVRRNRRALLVGVNEYPNLPEYSQLKGCVNDVRAMELVLTTTFEFSPEHVKVLVNEEATQAAIRGAMERMVKDCDEGDVVVFHFSGHGSQMAAEADKPRGFDESIMPYDSGRENPKFPKQVKPRDIRDTEIEEWLSRLSRKTPHITLIFDSCHSGSITRFGDDPEEGGTRLRWVPPDPPPAEAAPTGRKPLNARGPADASGSSGWLKPDARYVLLAACAAEQGAYECTHEGERYGVFTFFLTREIEQELNGARNKITYRDIWERVVVKVNERFQKQTPQLEGARDRVVFNVQELAAMRYLLVTSREGEVVQLNGGAIHGLTAGSHWDVYTAGTKQIREADAERLGTLEITSVGPVNARTRVVLESGPGAIVPGTRAVEAACADPETQMPLRLARAPRRYAQAVTELRRTLERSQLLRIEKSAEGERAEVRIVLEDGAAPAHVREGAGAKWEVTDGSGLLMPRYEVAASDSRERIRENLETIWRFKKILGLQHEKSPLRGLIDFTLLRKEADGGWKEVPEGETPVYKAGDSIAFRVVNRSGALIHVSVLDLGLSKRIEVLHPPAAASEPIEVRRSGESGGAQNAGVLSVGVGEADGIELYFPEDLTFITPAEAGQPRRGMEYFKLVATTHRHDLSFLSQAGFNGRSYGDLEHPLERLFYLAANRPGEREARPKLGPRDHWYTCLRPFWLQSNG